MAFLEISNGEQLTRQDLDESAVTCLEERQGTLKTFTAEQDELLTRPGIRFRAIDAALWRTKRGWVLMDYTGYKTLVNGLRVADCKHVCEGDVIQIGQVAAKLFEIRRARVRVDSDLLGSGKVCYVCYREFKVGEQVAFCSACGCPHHVECWLCTGTEDVYDVHCANCGASHQVDRKLHCARERKKQDRDGDVMLCPECGRPLASAPESDGTEGEDTPPDD